MQNVSKITVREIMIIYATGFLFAFVFQAWKMSLYLYDGPMWADQIKFFLTRDPAVFNMRAAYGHPGTTLISLGSLFHIIFGFSYAGSLTLSVALLIAAATAACVVLCYLLQPLSFWWVTTGIILTASRFYFTATPPTAVVLPFITLIVLASCRLIEKNRPYSKWPFFVWGIILGLSASTRLDVSLLVGMPLFMLLIRRHGGRTIMPVVIGTALSFIITDPFLWFMPFQHVIDLSTKFTIHYYGKGSITPIPWSEWVYGSYLAIVSVVWFLYFQIKPHPDHDIYPGVMSTFAALSLLAVIFLLFSKSQYMRYLYPLIMVWEIFLPLFAFQYYPDNHGKTFSRSVRLAPKTTWIIGITILTQILGYILLSNMNDHI